MSHDPTIELWSVRKAGDVFITLLPGKDNRAPCLRLEQRQGTTAQFSAIDVPLGQVRGLADKVLVAAADLAGILAGDPGPEPMAWCTLCNHRQAATAGPDCEYCAQDGSLGTMEVLIGDQAHGLRCESCGKPLPASTSPYHAGGQPVYLCEQCAADD